MLFMSCVCHVSRLFIAALWSPEGKGLTSWLLFMIFIAILLLSTFGILGQVWCLIVLIPVPCCLSYLNIHSKHQIIIDCPILLNRGTSSKGLKI